MLAQNGPAAQVNHSQTQALEKLQRLVNLKPIAHKSVEDQLAEQAGDRAVAPNNRGCSCGRACVDECLYQYEYYLTGSAQELVLFGVYALSKTESESAQILSSFFNVLGAVIAISMKASKLSHEFYKQTAALTLYNEIKVHAEQAGIELPDTEENSIEAGFKNENNMIFFCVFIGLIWFITAGAVVNSIAQIYKTNLSDNKTITSDIPIIFGSAGIIIIAALEQWIRVNGAEKTRAINGTLKHLQDDVIGAINALDRKADIQAVARAAAEAVTSAATKTSAAAAAKFVAAAASRAAARIVDGAAAEAEQIADVEDADILMAAEQAANIPLGIVPVADIQETGVHGADTPAAEAQVANDPFVNIQAAGGQEAVIRMTRNSEGGNPEATVPGEVLERLESDADSPGTGRDVALAFGEQRRNPVNGDDLIHGLG